MMNKKMQDMTGKDGLIFTGIVMLLSLAPVGIYYVAAWIKDKFDSRKED